MTGAANRKYFYEVLEQCCESQTYAFGSIIMIDVDDFKLYNQLYGTGRGMMP
ncbi:MAG: diguanylate cyclase domain-containing protein [Blautia marasmi]